MEEMPMEVFKKSLFVIELDLVGLVCHQINLAIFWQK